MAKRGRWVLRIVELSSLGAGKSGLVRGVKEDNRVVRRLMEMGVVPGTSVRVVRRAPLGDPIQVYLRGYCLTVRAKDARNILVEIEGEVQ